jgi:hypothetical protein
MNGAQMKLLDDALALVRDHRLVAMAKRMNRLEIILVALKEMNCNKS